jgi:hypothetical protein
MYLSELTEFISHSEMMVIFILHRPRKTGSNPEMATTEAEYPWRNHIQCLNRATDSQRFAFSLKMT